MAGVVQAVAAAVAPYLEGATVAETAALRRNVAGVAAGGAALLSRRGTARPRSWPTPPRKKKLSRYGAASRLQKAFRATRKRKRSGSGSGGGLGIRHGRAGIDSMTKHARTRGKHGKKGRLSLKRPKKALKTYNKKYKNVIAQKFWFCDPDRLDTTHKDILMRDRLQSREAHDIKHASLVLLNLHNTEALWSPIEHVDYNGSVQPANVVGNQLLPSNAESFLWNQTAAGEGLEALPQIYTLNAIPETATPKNMNLGPQPAVYEAPNSILSGVKLNMTVGSDRPYAQVFSIKLVRSVRGACNPGHFAPADPVVIAPPNDNRTKWVQELCNRGGATNGEFFSTIWTHTITLPALKAGQTPRRTTINKNIRLNLSRTRWRKNSAATNFELLGSQALPTFDYSKDGYFNQCYFVLSCYAKDDKFLADVNFATAWNAGGVVVTTETQAVQRPFPMSNISNPPGIPFQGTYQTGKGFPRFTYDGSCTVFHKVREMHRGLESFSTTLAVDNLRKEMLLLMNKDEPTSNDIDVDEEKTEDPVDLETGGRLAPARFSI